MVGTFLMACSLEDGWSRHTFCDHKFEKNFKFFCANNFSLVFLSLFVFSFHETHDGVNTSTHLLSLSGLHLVEAASRNPRRCVYLLLTIHQHGAWDEILNLTILFAGLPYWWLAGRRYSYDHPEACFWRAGDGIQTNAAGGCGADPVWRYYIASGKA